MLGRLKQWIYREKDWVNFAIGVLGIIVATTSGALSVYSVFVGAEAGANLAVDITQRRLREEEARDYKELFSVFCLSNPVNKFALQTSQGPVKLLVVDMYKESRAISAQRDYFKGNYKNLLESFMALENAVNDFNEEVKRSGRPQVDLEKRRQLSAEVEARYKAACNFFSPNGAA